MVRSLFVALFACALLVSGNAVNAQSLQLSDLPGWDRLQKAAQDASGIQIELPREFVWGEGETPEAC